MRRKGIIPIAIFVAVTFIGLTLTFTQGWRPFLGLDLQGGISVVMQPEGDVTDEQLDDAIAIIRSRIDTIGVAEPEITRQGSNIVVDIPGVRNQDEAKDLIRQTGELRFRPVLAELPPEFPTDATIDPNFSGDPDAPGEGGGTDTTVVPDTTVAPTTTAPVPDTTVAPGDEQGLGPSRRPAYVVGESASAAQETTPDTVTDLTTEAPTGAPTPAPTGGLDPFDLPIGPDGQIDISQLTDEQMAEIAAQSQSQSVATTAPEDDIFDQTVVLPQFDPETGQQVARFELGPAVLTGAGLETARASINQQGQWTVDPVFKAGAEGIDLFNDLASRCFNRDATCPTGRAAITLDGAVLSAPAIQTPSFSRDQVQISGTFTELEAKALGTVLRYGALPVELEVVSAQGVSATLGRDALDAGLIAGAIGMALVALYMLVFYRLLGLTAVVKLLFEGALLWVIISALGTNQGLALTLAGITGIIVSIGVSVDSNVVFYEHVKEDVRNGRTPRSAADKSFANAWKTIVKADVASLIAATLLYFLAVGPVRGFAFYLGLATVLDLVASWFFMRPVASMLLRTDLAQRRPKLLGLPDMSEREVPPKGPRRGEPVAVEVGA